MGILKGLFVIGFLYGIRYFGSAAHAAYCKGWKFDMLFNLYWTSIFVILLLVALTQSVLILLGGPLLSSITFLVLFTREVSKRKKQQDKRFRKVLKR